MWLVEREGQPWGSLGFVTTRENGSDLHIGIGVRGNTSVEFSSLLFGVGEARDEYFESGRSLKSAPVRDEK
jgi:hypothetical protein